MKTSNNKRIVETDVLVIGSGAGGAITASVLAKKGIDVTLVEEGSKFSSSELSPHSTIGMARLYRQGGISPILGNPSIAFVEGCCVGGSTEINSGLFHRTPEDTFERWKKIADVDEFTPAALEPYFEELEKKLNVSFLGKNPPKSSSIMKTGAENLGWKYVEVPRAQRNCIGANLCSVGCPTGAKQSMSVTYIKEGLKNGMKLMPNCKVVKLEKNNNRIKTITAKILDNSSPKEMIKFRANDVFVCCGAIQTPALLRRSGIKRNIGNNLKLHPTVKITAIMDEEINAIESTVPVYQVFEFSPDIVLGGSVFSLPYAASGLSDCWEDAQNKMKEWRNMVTYYALVRSSGKGKVRPSPISSESAIACYKITEEDKRKLSIGLARLGQLFFAAGAKELFPTISGHPPIKSTDECLVYLEKDIPIKKTSLLTIHVFSSCPMGENKNICAANSFGKIWNFENLYINDSSLFVDALGVNPQGTIMGIALRNVHHYLSNRKN